jgi:hypothetical protein
VWVVSRSDAIPYGGASIPKVIVPHRLRLTLKYKLEL